MVDGGQRGLVHWELCASLWSGQVEMKRHLGMSPGCSISHLLSPSAKFLGACQPSPAQ